MIKKTILFGLITLLLSACEQDKIPVSLNPDCTDTVSYSNDIVPLLEQHCNGCHDAGAGGYSFTDHSSTASNAQDIMSSLYGSSQLMPLGGPALPDSLIKLFQCWLEQGTKNN